MWFDSSGVPVAHLRFLRTTAVIGALLFGITAAYGFMTMFDLLGSPAKDLQAVMILAAVAFLFVMSGLIGSAAVVLTVIAVRCWMAIGRR